MWVALRGEETMGRTYKKLGVEARQVWSLRAKFALPRVNWMTRLCWDWEDEATVILRQSVLSFV